jgi:hypothetical protein
MSLKFLALRIQAGGSFLGETPNQAQCDQIGQFFAKFVKWA